MPNFSTFQAKKHTEAAEERDSSLEKKISIKLIFEFEPSLFRWLICLIFIVPDNCEILRTFNHLFASLIQTKVEGIRKGSPSEPTTRQDTSGFMQCNRPKNPWFILSPSNKCCFKCLNTRLCWSYKLSSLKAISDNTTLKPGKIMLILTGCWQWQWCIAFEKTYSGKVAVCYWYSNSNGHWMHYMRWPWMHYKTTKFYCISLCLTQPCWAAGGGSNTLLLMLLLLLLLSSVLCQLSNSFYLPLSIYLTHFLIWEAEYCFYVIYSIIHLSCFPLLCNAAMTN